MRRAVLFLLALVLAGALLVGLRPTTPARTLGDYRHKAKDTAESVLASVQTARLVARAARAGDIFGTYGSVSLSESDTGIGKAAAAFDGVQPPDVRADRVRDRLDALIARAGARVSGMRIAARRGDWDGVQREARHLPAIARDLQAFIDRNARW